jgi:predicted nuclease of predicted toxin-antitoxin system
LIDAQLPKSLKEFFSAKGYQSLHVGDLMVADATDETIFQRAQDLSAIIVTKDADFPLIRSRKSGPQIVWLRVGNVRKRDLAATLEQLWPEIIKELMEGGQIVEIRG